jgi:hypothetical protein
MVRSQKSYREETLAEAGRIARESVLAIYPDAEMIEREQWDMDMRPKWAVAWPNQSLQNWLFAGRTTREGAWERAWYIIQHEMLDQLEK